MRFVISGEWTKNHLLKVIILFFLFYIALFWITNLLLFVNKMGFSYQGVVDYYIGSEDRYLQPRSYQGLLEVSHFHLFAMGILMLTLTHLILFVPLSPGVKMIYVLSAFGSAILDEAASWLVRFAGAEFAYLKLAAFTALQLALLCLIVHVSFALIKGMPSAYNDNRSR